MRLHNLSQLLIPSSPMPMPLANSTEHTHTHTKQLQEINSTWFLKVKKINECQFDGDGSSSNFIATNNCN